MTVVSPRRSALNPVAKLAAAVIVGAVLVLSIDWVSASVALAMEAIALPWLGLSLRQFFRRTAAVWVAAVFSAVTIALYGQSSGAVRFEWLFVHVTDGSLELAIATLLRVLAIGLPAVVLFVTIDPTDLADGLAQIVHLPSRFVLGALAGLRLISLFLEDWRGLELARRARGVADRGRLRRFLSQGFTLLVLSIRRGGTLATVMEARGFGGSTPRTWARPSRFHRADVALIAVGAIIAAAAVWASVATGHWTFIVH
jgi:energy-coupling factor transport system permease protein